MGENSWAGNDSLCPVPNSSGPGEPSTKIGEASEKSFYRGPVAPHVTHPMQFGSGMRMQLSYDHAEAATPELPLSANEPARSIGARPQLGVGGCCEKETAVGRRRSR